MSWVRSWRVPLRMARRDAARSRARSLLVLVMIALPVTAVTAADVAIHTSDVDTRESLSRRLGTAQAVLQAQQGGGHVVQGIDPEQQQMTDGDAKVPLATTSSVGSVLTGSRLLPFRSSDVRVRSRHGVAVAQGLEVDGRDPLTRGLLTLDSGRWPTSADQVVVNGAMLDEGYAVGKRLDLVDADDSPRIVGVVESTTVRSLPYAVGLAGSLALPSDGVASWYAGEGGPVSWSQVKQLNTLGVAVLSRSVVLDPPPNSQLPADFQRGSGGLDSATLAAASLVVVMALIEVVLLAGPAFAVGARRQARSLALMAATGGTPRQSRRVVLAGAVVLGGIAALVGTGLGIAVAAGALPFLQRLSVSWFGPFQVPWLQLLGIAAFGMLSAFLAAVVPAWIASRQDVVAVLAGRRGDRRPSRRSPLVGVLLMAAGVGGAVLGATRAGGETLIAGAAILCVLGMVLLVPVVVATVSRLAGRLPLPLRYAARDAARHRTRTVPAVAAVAATVAGVVALGIALTSDGRQNEATYHPQLTMGVGAIHDYDPKPDWATLQRTAERQLPGARVTPVRGVSSPSTPDQSFTLEIDGSDGHAFMEQYGSSLGSDTLVTDSGLPAGISGLDGAGRQRADDALRAGRAVVFTDGRGEASTPARFTLTRYDAKGEEHVGKPQVLDATTVHLAGIGSGPQAVLPGAVAKRLSLPVAQVSLVLDGAPISGRQASALTEALQAVSADTGLYVERGFQRDTQDTVVLIVLALLGAVLMLGGTLTATFLALSDARADLATLSAVGATPRTRRSVAAAYALVLGVVGAVLGAVVGFVPGLAVAVPLTKTDEAGPFLAVPWPMITALVVALPLLTAVVVGLTARSRLPLVARLD